MRPLRFCLFVLLAVLFCHTTTHAQRAELVVQTGHRGEINSVAFSPDGKTLASGSGDKTIILWDVSSGRQLRTLTGHTDWVTSVAFSPDGKTLASGSEDNTIKLWDVTSGRELRTLTGQASVASVAFSPDGKTLAGSGSDDTIKLWDVTSGKKLRSLTGHSRLVGSLAFSPDGKTLACGSEDQLKLSNIFSANPEKIKLWDVASGRELRSLTGHSDYVLSVAFSPDGKTLASGSGDSTIKLWDVSSGRELRTLKGHSGLVKSVAFSPDGKTLASGSHDKTIKVWDVTSGRELRSLTGNFYLVASVAFSPDGKTLACGSQDQIKLWDVASGRELRALTAHFLPITSVAFSLDGNRLASGSHDKTIKLWDASGGTELRSLTGHSNGVSSVALSPDGKTLASSSFDDTIKLWDVASGAELRSLAWHSSYEDSLAFSPDGKTLASGGSWDHTIKLWDLSSGTESRSLTGHSSGVTSVAFSSDGKTLASGSFDNTIKLWDVANGTELRSLRGHSRGITSVAFSSDGKTLASSSLDDTIKLWGVASGTELRSLAWHSSDADSVAFSPDGERLASSLTDSFIKLWRVVDGTELASLVALDEKDWAILTPDGFFDGAPNAWKQLIWRLDNNTFNFVAVEAFFKEFYYPGLLQEIMAGRKPKPPARNLAEVDIRQPGVNIARVNEQAASERALSQLATPANAVSRRNVRVAVEITDNLTAPARTSHPATGGAQDVRLFRNGSLVKLWRGDAFKLSEQDGCRQQGSGKVICEATVPIIAGANDFTAYAFNHDNVKSSDAKLTVTGAETLKRTGALYVLAIGVGQYENPQYNLNYTAADARDFGEEVKRQQEKLDRYARVEVIPLFDQSATKAKILATLQKFAETVQPEDGVIVYFSGHGTAQGDRFYLIPHDIGYMGSRKELSTAGLQEILAHSISDVELEAAFRTLDAGELVLVIDSCNSGKALQADDWRRGPMNTKGLGQLAYEKGMYILTASQDVELAYESEALRHSYLTYALVEQGLKTAAADKEPMDGQVTLREWFGYAMQAVPRLRQQKVEQEAKKQGKTLEEVEVVERSKVQQPRVFYRREPEARPFVVTKVGATK